VLAGAFFSRWPGQLLTWWVRSRGATVSLARARLCGSGRTTVARFAGTAGLATTRFTVVPNMFHALAQSIHQVVDLRLSLLFLRSDYIAAVDLRRDELMDLLAVTVHIMAKIEVLVGPILNQLFGQLCRLIRRPQVGQVVHEGRWTLDRLCVME